MGGSPKLELDWDGGCASSDRERSVEGEAGKLLDGCN